MTAAACSRDVLVGWDNGLGVGARAPRSAPPIRATITGRPDTPTLDTRA